jgi:hypothetical protein
MIGTVEVYSLVDRQQQRIVLGRPGSPQEITGIARFLALHATRFSTS